jgi:hypothetical protein
MENSVNFIACADALNALMQVKPIQTLMHFAKCEEACIACATECENILT